MKFITIKEFSQNPSRTISSKDSVVITKYGKPVQLLIAIDDEGLEDFILASHYHLKNEAKTAIKASNKNKTKSAAQLKAKYLNS